MWINDEHVSILKKSDGLKRNNSGNLCLTNDNQLSLYGTEYFNPNEIPVGAAISNMCASQA